MTFNDVEVILNLIKSLRIHNVSIHIHFYKNQSLNECVRKTFLKFPYRCKDGVIFVRCRRTYVLNNINNEVKCPYLKSILCATVLVITQKEKKHLLNSLRRVNYLHFNLLIFRRHCFLINVIHQ